MNAAAAQPLRVFISYRHADRRILDAIRDHLGWLENDKRIRIFDDSKIVAGENWDDTIKSKLQQVSNSSPCIDCKIYEIRVLYADQIEKITGTTFATRGYHHTDYCRDLRLDRYADFHYCRIAKG